LKVYKTHYDDDDKEESQNTVHGGHEKYPVDRMKITVTNREWSAMHNAKRKGKNH
jgi:hypothetical protein